MDSDIVLQQLRLLMLPNREPLSVAFKLVHDGYRCRQPTTVPVRLSARDRTFVPGHLLNRTFPPLKKHHRGHIHPG